MIAFFEPPHAHSLFMHGSRTRVCAPRQLQQQFSQLAGAQLIPRELARHQEVDHQAFRQVVIVFLGFQTLILERLKNLVGRAAQLHFSQVYVLCLSRTEQRKLEASGSRAVSNESLGETSALQQPIRARHQLVV